MSHIKACQAEGQEARRKHERTFFNAWNGGKRERRSEQMESNSRGTDNEKGNFSPVESFDSLHWVITP